MKPYQQKELVNLVLHKAVLGEKGIKIALHGKIPDAGLLHVNFCFQVELSMHDASSNLKDYAQEKNAKLRITQLIA